MKKSILYLFLVVSIWGKVNVGFAQCAMCRSTVESNQTEEVTNRAQGLNTGILYLMVIPYILFGVIGYLWYSNSKKQKAEREKIDEVIRRAEH